MPLFRDTTPEEVRKFLASKEFITDLEYMPSMDTAWHNWLQPKWDKQRKEWLKNA